MLNLRKIGRKFVLPDKDIKEKVLAFLEKYPQKNQNKNSSDICRILDFGSGTLFWSEWLKDEFKCKVFAYDPGYKNHPINKKDELIETFFELKIDIDYDMVFVCDVLHHIKKDELTKTLETFAKKANYVVIKDIEASDYFGNLQNKLHDLIINHTKTTDIYGEKLFSFFKDRGFKVEKYNMKKLGYPHFLLLAKRGE